MDSDSILWLLIVVFIINLLAFIIYQIMCLSDLEADYVNPFETSSKVNAVVVPEFLVQGALCGVLIVSGRWFMFLGNVPLAYYHLRLFLRREHLLDVTEIYRNLTREKKTRLKKLGVYLVYFFLAILSIPAGLVSLSAVVSSKRGELDLRASFLEF